MDEEERQQKLEAGKAKFAKFLKKKGNTGERKKKKLKNDLVLDETLSNSNGGDGTAASSEKDDVSSQADTESECLSMSREEGDPKSSLSDEISFDDFPMSPDKSKCDLVIARQRILELQEFVDGKTEAFETVLEENNDLRFQLSHIQQSLDSSLDTPTSVLDDEKLRRFSTPDYQTVVGQYSRKLEEYRKALSQREEIIQQLTERLIATLASRDEVQKDSVVQAESLAQEISLLKFQLQQVTEVLLKQQTGSGISPQELLNARNEALFLNQENLRKDSLIQDLVAKLKKANSDMENLQESFELDILRCQEKIHSLETEIHKESIENEVNEAEKGESVECYKLKFEEALKEIEKYQSLAFPADESTFSHSLQYKGKIDVLTEENIQLQLKLNDMQNQVQLLYQSVGKDVSAFTHPMKEILFSSRDSDGSCSSLNSPSKQQGLIGKELFNLIDLKDQGDDDFSQIEPCFEDIADSSTSRHNVYAIHDQVSYVESDSQTDAVASDTEKFVEKGNGPVNRNLEASKVSLSLRGFESEKLALISELENLGKLFSDVNELKLFLSVAQQSIATISSEMGDMDLMSDKISQLQAELDNEKMFKENILKELNSTTKDYELQRENVASLQADLKKVSMGLDEKSLELVACQNDLEKYKNDLEKVEKCVTGQENIGYSFDSQIESVLSIVKMFQELRSQNQCLNSVLEESEYSKNQLEKSLLQLTEKYKNELQEKELALITVSERCLDNHLKNLEISNTANAFEQHFDDGTIAELERMSNAVSEVQVLNARVQEITDERTSLEHKLAQLSHDLEELVEANFELKSEKNRIEIELMEKVNDLEDVKQDLEAHLDKLKMQLNLSESAKEELRREVNIMTEKHDNWLTLTRDQLIEELPRFVVEEHRNCGASFLLLEEQLRMETENKNAILAQMAYYSKRNEQHEKMYREISKRYQESKDLLRQIWDDRDKLKRELMEIKYEKSCLEAAVINLKESLAEMVSSKESQDICVKKVSNLGGLSDNDGRHFANPSVLNEHYSFQNSSCEITEVQRHLIFIFGEPLLKMITQVATLKGDFKLSTSEAVQDKIEYFCTHDHEQYGLYKKVIEDSRKTLKDLVWLNNAIEAVNLDVEYEQSEKLNRDKEIQRCKNELSSIVDTIERESIIVRNVKDLGNETNIAECASFKDCRFDLDESLCQKNDEEKKLVYQMSLQKLCDIEDDLNNAFKKWNSLCVSYLEITVIKQKDIAKLDSLQKRLAEAINNKESRDICIKDISLLGGDEPVSINYDNTSISDTAPFFQVSHSPEGIATYVTDDTGTPSLSQVNTVKHFDDNENMNHHELTSENATPTKDSDHKTELFSDNSSSIKEDIEEYTDSCISDDLYNILENQFMNGAANDVLENAEALITMAEIDINKTPDEKLEPAGLADNAQLLMELQNLQFDFVQKDIEIQTVKMESSVRESYLEMIHKEKLVMLREILTKDKLRTVFELKDKMNHFHEKVLNGLKMKFDSEIATHEIMLRKEYNEKLREINESYKEKLSNIQASNTSQNNNDFKESVLTAIHEATLDAKSVEMYDNMFREMTNFKEQIDKKYSSQVQFSKEISEIQRQIQTQISEKSVYNSEAYQQTDTPFFKVINDIAKEVTDHLNNLTKRWSLSVSFNLDSLPKLDSILLPVNLEDENAAGDTAQIIALKQASVILDQREKFLHEAKDMQDCLETYSTHVKKLLKAMEIDYELILLKKEEINRECTEISDKETQTALSDGNSMEVRVETESTSELCAKQEFWQVSNQETATTCRDEATGDGCNKLNTDLEVDKKELEQRYESEMVKLCSENAGKIKEIIDKHNAEIQGLSLELTLMKDNCSEMDELRIEMSDLINDHKTEVETLRSEVKDTRNEASKRQNELQNLQAQLDELKLKIEHLNQLATEKEEFHSNELEDLIATHEKEKTESALLLENIKKSHEKELCAIEAGNTLKIDSLITKLENEKESVLKDLKDSYNCVIQELTSEITSLKNDEHAYSNQKSIYDFLVTKSIELCLQNSVRLDEESIKSCAAEFMKNTVHQVVEFESSQESSEDHQGKIRTIQQTLILDLETLIHDKQQEFGSPDGYVQSRNIEESLDSLRGERIRSDSHVQHKGDDGIIKNQISLLRSQIVELEYVNSTLQEEIVKVTTKPESKPMRDWLAGTELSAADIQTWQVHTAQTNSRLMNVLSDLVKTFVDTEQTIQNHLSRLGLSVQQSSEGGSLVEEENGPLSGTFHGSREDCTLSSLGDALPLEMCDDIPNLTPRAWDTFTSTISGIQQEPDTEGEDVVLGASRRLRAAVDHVLSLITELIENSQNQDVTELVLKNQKLIMQLKEESQLKSQLQSALNKAEEILNSMKDDDESKMYSSQGERSRIDISKTSPKRVECLHKSKEDVIEDTTVSESHSKLLKLDIQDYAKSNGGEKNDDWKLILKRVHYLELALEEVSSQKDEIGEEKQREIDDLKEQMEAMEKQMQSNKRFIEEQAHEREQEQEDFFKELEKIKESLREKERTQTDDGQLSSEVDLLEQQLKLKSQSCDDLRDKMVENEARLRSTKDKISDLQEVISEMENQLETKNKLNEELNQQLASFTELLTEHEEAQNEMTKQIEDLKTSLRKEFSDHISSLEEQLESKSQEMEQLTHCQTLMQEFRSQIHVLDERLESKIRQLEHFSWHLSPGTSEESSLSDSKDQEERLLLIQEGRVLSPRSIHGEEIRKLESKIDSLLNATDEAIKRLKDSEDRIRSMKLKSDELQTERSLLQQQLNDQLYQISTLKTRMEDARYDVKSKISSQEFNSIKDDLTKHKEKVKELKQELEVYHAKHSSIQEQLQENANSMAQLEGEVLRFSHEKEEVLSDNLSLKENVTDLQEKFKAISQENDLLVNELREIKTKESLVHEIQVKCSVEPLLKPATVQTDFESVAISALQNDASRLKEALLNEEALRAACHVEIKKLETKVDELSKIVDQFQHTCAKQDEEINYKNSELTKLVECHKLQKETLTTEYERKMESNKVEIERLSRFQEDLKKSMAENALKVEDRFRQKLDIESNALSLTYEQSLNKIREQHVKSMKELEDNLTDSFMKELSSIKATNQEVVEEEKNKWMKKMKESSNSHLSNQRFLLDDYESQLAKLIEEKDNYQSLSVKHEQLLATKETELKEIRARCVILEEELERFRNNLLISRDSTPESDSTVSSQATSTGDDGSLESVRLPPQLQKLFDKVLKEGLEVLSLTERKQISHHVGLAEGEQQDLSFNDKQPIHLDLFLKAKDNLLEEVKSLKEIMIMENQGNNDESIAAILRDFLKREKNRLLLELQSYSIKQGHKVLATCKELEDKIYSLEDRQEATLKDLYELVHSQLSKERSGNLQLQQEILLLKDQVEKGTWQIKKQRDLLDYKGKQEKIQREEFQSSLEREQLNSEQLTAQLRQLRNRCSELELSLSLRQSEFQKNQQELERIRRECDSYKAAAEAEKNHANSLLQALEAERANFSQVHMALDSEREHRKTLLSRDQQLINKLQASIDVQSYSESVSSRTLSPEIPRLREDTNSVDLALSSMHQNNSLITPMKEKCLKCGFYETILSQERSNWKKHEDTMTKLLQSAESEVAQLKQKMLLTNSTSKIEASSHRQKLLQVHWKYRKSEKHRMSLVYQKRYLLKLLQGYQKTESAALNVLTQMGVCSPTSSTQGSIYEGFGLGLLADSSVTTVSKRKKRMKFRSVVHIIIGTLRFRYFLDRSNQAQQFFIYGKQQQQISTNETLFISSGPSAVPNIAPIKEVYGLSHLFPSTSCSSSSSTSSKHWTNKYHHVVFDNSSQQEKALNNSNSSTKSNADLTRGPSKLQECVIRLENMHKALGLDA